GRAEGGSSEPVEVGGFAAGRGEQDELVGGAPLAGPGLEDLGADSPFRGVVSVEVGGQGWVRSEGGIEALGRGHAPHRAPGPLARSLDRTLVPRISARDLSRRIRNRPWSGTVVGARASMPTAPRASPTSPAATPRDACG